MTPRALLLVVQPRWRGHYNAQGTWSSDWPPNVCKECSKAFQGSPDRRWCSDRCRRSARNRSGNHGGRTADAARRLGLPVPAYEIIGKFELLQAFGGLCGKCGRDLLLADVWTGHIIGVEHVGPHTRRNIAAIHKACEQDWNREQRTG